MLLQETYHPVRFMFYLNRLAHYTSTTLNGCSTVMVANIINTLHMDKSPT